MLNLTALWNQLARYKPAEADVTAYVQSATGATTFVPTTESAAFLCNMMYSLKRYTDICECINTSLWICDLQCPFAPS